MISRDQFCGASYALAKIISMPVRGVTTGWSGEKLPGVELAEQARVVTGWFAMPQGWTRAGWIIRYRGFTARTV